MDPLSPQPPPRDHLYSPWFFYLLGALTTAIVAGIVYLIMRRPDPPPIILHPPPTTAPTPTPLPTATPPPIVVYVSGSVHKPGLYDLPAGARVGDAVAMAGGFTADAEAGVINQAEKLWDGAQVYIPNHAEPATAPSPGVSGQTAGNGSSGDAGNETANGAASGAPNAPININTAGATELETLPGIGPSKAADIIANRPYATVDDLTRVPGIGAKTVDRLRKLIVVQ